MEIATVCDQAGWRSAREDCRWTLRSAPARPARLRFALCRCSAGRIELCSSSRARARCGSQPGCHQVRSSFLLVLARRRFRAPPLRLRVDHTASHAPTRAAPARRGPLADRRLRQLECPPSQLNGGERIRVLSWNILAQARRSPLNPASCATSAPAPSRLAVAATVGATLSPLQPRPPRARPAPAPPQVYTRSSWFPFCPSSALKCGLRSPVWPCSQLSTSPPAHHQSKSTAARLWRAPRRPPADPLRQVEGPVRGPGEGPRGLVRGHPASAGGGPVSGLLGAPVAPNRLLGGVQGADQGHGGEEGARPCGGGR